MNIAEYIQECGQMQAELESLIPDDINSVVEKAKVLAVLMSRSGEMLAVAKKAMRKKKASEMMANLKELAKQAGLTASERNAMLDTYAAEEMEIVDWLDRINAHCSRTIELCRSIISKEKAEMAFLHFQK